MAEGGDVFILDMGKPIKIYDLAERMIELSGLSLKNKLNIKGDIENASIKIIDLFLVLNPGGNNIDNLFFE